MSWTITPSQALPDDADAVAYIAAVEAADTAAGSPGGLEPAVRLAYNSFIKGCKADGIWPAIKASCILAGARTLAGALVPLVGTAPTNYNFVSGDYNRKTGLVGDGSSKYLNTSRNNNADPQNNRHLSVYATTGGTSFYIGAANAGGLQGRSYIAFNNSTSLSAQLLGANSFPVVLGNTGFTGLTRRDAVNYSYRNTGVTTTAAHASSAPENVVYFTHSSVQGGFSSARLAFYSIGEALDLALLDTRVTALVNALAAAIP